ncbi:hypothetical protein GTW43_30720 [Streptomyces sp. SID5785]|uniref:alpha/beta fold hydrolase n=1 Tax=Streptomyces sp. SID5785 TaxID=2690309 RepID=UPI0013614097|nr:alpha/beta hydrolase [Streptomyces sp. SID5785]MZD09422.1 hypothetical protein [Streptomyces sp. SID5785]
MALPRSWTTSACRTPSWWATRQAAWRSPVTAPRAGAALVESIVHEDHRPTLRKVSVPAQAVHGTVDSSAPVALTGRRTAELIPGAVFKAYPTAGAGLYITRKEQLNADLLEFVRAY